MKIKPDIIVEKILVFIRQEISNHQRDGAILGMSGGIDSSVTASLLVGALGASKVRALLLPERDSSPESKTDALSEIERLGISYREIDMVPILDTIGLYKLLPLRILGVRQIKGAVVKQQHQRQVESLGEPPFLASLLGTSTLGTNKEIINAGNAYARVKHRLRMLLLYYYAEQQNLLVVGTTNRSEAMTGFVVKWGDNVADIEPILPLYKTQVRQLAEYLDVSPKIIAKAPSPDLIPGIEDEFALGIDYETLDSILWGLDNDWEDVSICARFGIDRKLVQHVHELINRSAHTRHLPPHPDLNS